MKYLSLFSGIGGFEIGIDKAWSDKSNSGYATQQSTETESIRPQWDKSDSTSVLGDGWGECPICIGYSEIDPYADAIYKYNFGGTDERRSIEDEEQQTKRTGNKERQLSEFNNKRTIGQHSCRNYGDVTKIDPKELPDFDLLVGGFPCQAFSIAGKRRGFDDTRGTLIFDVLRILKEKQPRHFILENVKGLLSHDSGNTFRTIITSLAELGYAVEWQVLNAKNFGVPQNRERVFIVGHLGGFGGRQVFPIRGSNEEAKNTVHPTLDANYYKGHSNQRKMIADYRNDEGLRIRKKEPGISPCLNARRHSETDISTMPNLVIDEDIKIRRLTPTECERLMGYPDDWTKYGLYGDEVKEMSDTRRYKACGNGVVSNVVEEVVKRLYKEEK